MADGAQHLVEIAFVMAVLARMDAGSEKFVASQKRALLFLFAKQGVLNPIRCIGNIATHTFDRFTARQMNRKSQNDRQHKIFFHE